MKLKVECSECGEPMIMEHDENAEVIRVKPCICGDIARTVRVERSTIVIGE